MKVSIVVFEVNEIDGLKATMPQIKEGKYDEIIVVDGGSTDGSIEYLKENGYNYFIQQGKGPGAAINEAVKKSTGDIVILYAPDGSFLTDRIPMIVEKIRQGYDIVNVSRYCKGGKSEDDNIFTWCGNKFFTILARLFDKSDCRKNPKENFNETAKTITVVGCFRNNGHYRRPMCCGDATSATG